MFAAQRALSRCTCRPRSEPMANLPQHVLLIHGQRGPGRIHRDPHCRHPANGLEVHGAHKHVQLQPQPVLERRCSCLELPRTESHCKGEGHRPQTFELSSVSSTSRNMKMPPQSGKEVTSQATEQMTVHTAGIEFKPCGKNVAVHGRKLVQHCLHSRRTTEP